MENSTKKLSSSVQIYALGGLGEVGKNMYCIENDNSLIIIDAGILFPEEDYPGVDYVIPDYTHLKEQQAKIKALFITHGHEDHIGAIPFLLMQVNIPIIYAPKLAAALIRTKLEEHKLKNAVKIIEYSDDNIVHTGDFTVEFVHVTHSIPDSFGIFVTTPQGTILHTGDFKIDLTPVDRDFDLAKLARLGDRGVDLLLADSTNADKEGYTPSEKTVINSINDVFRHANGRLIISTFSSNLSRIQQIIDATLRFGRKICIFGRSMESNIQNARDFGYIKIPNTSIIQPEALKTTRNNEIVILCTGSQGEPMAALSRIANGEHRYIHIQYGDTVVFSSSPIPGNNASINHVVNQLVKCGADVLVNSAFYNLHASGHPCKQELRIIQKLVRPKYFMPIHGEFHMLKQHADVAVEVGMPRENTFVLANGDCLRLYAHTIKETSPVHADAIYIDGNNINGVSNSVIQDRKTMANCGLVSIIIGVDLNLKKLTIPPIVDTYGFMPGGHKAVVLKRISDFISKDLPKKLSSSLKKENIQEYIKHVALRMYDEEKVRHPITILTVLIIK